MLITIRADLEQQARDYAHKSREYLSARRDCHEGGLDAREEKMLEGKLGEKAVQQFFENYGISYKEDTTHFTEADNYDFLCNGYKVDVKTRTQPYHTRTLEIKEQIEKKPKDIYIACRLHKTIPFTVSLIGYATSNDFLQANRLEVLKQEYGVESYSLYDNELRPIVELINLL